MVLAGFLQRPDRARPDRGQARHLRRAPRPGRRDRCHPDRHQLASLPDAIRGEPDVSHPEGRVVPGQAPAPLGLRIARRDWRTRPVRPHHLSPRGHHHVRVVPARGLEADLVKQSERAVEQGTTAPHQLREDLSRRPQHHPARRRCPRRATLQMGRYGPRCAATVPGGPRQGPS